MRIRFDFKPYFFVIIQESNSYKYCINYKRVCMNNFFKEIVGIAKLPFNEILKDFKVIMISNKVIYVSNYIKILDYSTEKVVLKVHNNILEIQGDNLFISQINKSEIVIKGIIDAYFLGVNDAKNK